MWHLLMEICQGILQKNPIFGIGKCAQLIPYFYQTNDIQYINYIKTPYNYGKES